MKLLIFTIVLSIVPCLVYASSPVYVFVIDENSKPLHRYRAYETDQDNVFISRIEPVKKWIIYVRSQLIVVKDGYFYSVKDVIIDRKNAIAMLKIALSERKPLYFNPEGKPAQRSKKIDYLALARRYEETGQWDRAVQAYEKMEQKNPEIIETIGMLYYRLGKFKKAEEYFSRLPKNEMTVSRLACIYIIEKEYESALRILDSHSFNSPYIHYLKGLIYYLTNRKDDAYREALILFSMDRQLGQNLRELLR